MASASASASAPAIPSSATAGLIPTQVRSSSSTSGRNADRKTGDSNGNKNKKEENSSNRNDINNNNNRGRQRKRDKNNDNNKNNNNKQDSKNQNEINESGVSDPNDDKKTTTANNNKDQVNNSKTNNKPRSNRNRNNKDRVNNNASGQRKRQSQRQQEEDDGKSEKQRQSSSPKSNEKSNNRNNNNKNSGKNQIKDGNNNNNNNRRNKQGRKRYPWRKYIPPGSVDPITLESLQSLSYPPFALRSTAPYIPVIWPPPQEDKDEKDNKTVTTKEDTGAAAKERERQLLQEQWGNALSSSKDKEQQQRDGGGKGQESIVSNKNDGSIRSAQQQVDIINPLHINLFDGRALAYYMVSQLQFIDPLNRRDLSREELIHLDHYLKNNRFNDLNVVEAYDTKGVSISTAGATAATAAGRAEILQQEAQVLLNALFSHSSVGGTNSNSNSNSNNNNQYSNPLQQQYSNYQAAQQEHAYSGTGNDNNNTRYLPDEHDTGVYGDEEGGMLVIDDDLNPSLRGGRGLRPFRATQQSGTSNDPTPTTLWSSNRITGQHGQSNPAGPLQDHFPALSVTAAAARATNAADSSLHASAPTFVPGSITPAASGASGASSATAGKTPKKILPPANSLKFITKAVKKTSPEEQQRQFEAREEARRKAMLSNLTFGSNPASWMGGEDSKPSAAAFPSAAAPTPTDGQLDRNRAFAEALGVPTTENIASRLQGWARPTSQQQQKMATYPDALILSARERMTPLLKLERKWKTFLEDDKAASLPLNKMDRDMRKFVHEYSDFWKLHTESFDPEPRRYIHCVKLLDTAAPYPLLSDAVKHWRGPGTGPYSEHALYQTAGQDTYGLPRGPRASTMVDAEPAVLEPTNPRAAGFLSSQRPKLELKERTLPLELPPFQPPANNDNVLQVDTAELLRRRQERIDEQKRKEQEREELKQKTLAAAFASDSEDEGEESLGEVDADSDWEEGEELFTGGDEEEAE